MKKTILAAAVLCLGFAAAFAQKPANNARASAAVRQADAKVEAVRRSMDTTVTTDVYGVQTVNKRGTMDYGVMSETVNGQPQEDVLYASYQPSRAALSNGKDMEVSVACGGSYCTN